MRSLLGLSVTACFACGVTTIPGRQPDGGTVADDCSITLSGALTGTFDCLAQPTGGYDATKNETAITVAAGNAGQATNASPNVDIGLGYAGTLHTGVFHQSDSGAKGGVAVTGTANASWLAAQDNGTPMGTWTLNLTGATTIAGNSTGAADYVHGTVDATLPAVANSGASGTVTLHASF